MVVASLQGRVAILNAHYTQNPFHVSTRDIQCILVLNYEPWGVWRIVQPLYHAHDRGRHTISRHSKNDTFMRQKSLVICPVYNEQATIADFYRHLRTWYSRDVLFVDDGSTDDSRNFIADVQGAATFLLRHPVRGGYGAALRSGFRFSLRQGYTRIVTIDGDLQHDPGHIPHLLCALEQEEVVLGSRYMMQENVGHVPQIRLTINRYISGLILRLFSVRFTDPFCGLRGYRDSFLKRCSLTDESYGLGLEIILEIVRTRIPFTEVPIRAIYNNHLRKFLDGLDEPRTRLLYYLELLSAKRNMIIQETGRIEDASAMCEMDAVNI